MKKMISLMLCLVMILSLSVPALAADGNARKITIDSPAFCADVIAEMADSLEMKADESDLLDLERSFYLYNFNNEPIAIFYQLSPVGYAIYDYAGTTVLEYTKEANHPFYTNQNQRYYYEGVFGYYEAVANGFRNLATGQIKSINADYRFDSSDFYHSTEGNDGMITRATENPVYLDNDTRLYDCNTSSNLSYFYPDLSQEDLDDCPGICGSLACSVLLAYYDDYHSDLGDFVDDWKKISGQNTDGAYGKPLVKEIIGYVEPNANGSVFLNPGVSSYLSDRGITGRVQMGILTVYQQTKNAVGDGSGDPIIVGTTSHYSIGVGYKNITEKQIYTNTGYGYHAWVRANTIISTWTMHID